MSSQCESFLSAVGLIALSVVSFTVVYTTGDVNCPSSWLQRNQTKECYFISSDAADFFTAKDLCRNMSANLASVLDADANNFLNDAIQLMSPCGLERKCSSSWIGLFRSNFTSNKEMQSDERVGWLWIDGSDYSMTWNNWNISRPLNNDSCASFLPGVNEWIGTECATPLTYICLQRIKDSSVISVEAFDSTTDAVTPGRTLKLSSGFLDDWNSLPSDTPLSSSLSSATKTGHSSSVPLINNSYALMDNQTTVTLSVINSSSHSDYQLTTSLVVSDSLLTTTVTKSSLSLTSDSAALPSLSSVDDGGELSEHSLTATSQTPNSFSIGKTLVPVTYSSVSRHTDYFFEDNTTAKNGTVLPNEGSPAWLLAVCIGVSVGAFAIITGISIGICVICKRRRKKAQSVSVSIDMLPRTDSINDYDYLDSFTVSSDMHSVRPTEGYGFPETYTEYLSRQRLTWPTTPELLPVISPAVRQVSSDEYRQLNEQLLTLKRPLENSVVDGVFSEDLMSLICDTSSKILDIVWQHVGNGRHRRPLTASPLQSFVSEFLSSNVLFLENLISLQLKIATLLQLIPSEGILPTVDRCRYSLQSIDALLRVGMENISYVSLVNSECNDILLEANPVFRDLLGQATIIRFRLETYYVLHSHFEPDDNWKSKLFECLSGTESSIKDAFSDVVENSDPSEPESSVEDESFPNILERKLRGFRHSTDPVMPQVRCFLQGIDSLAANYVSATLDEVGQLTTNILHPTVPSILSEETEANVIYQNLSPVYDMPHSNVYHNIQRHILVDDPYSGLLPPDEDIYEESPVNLRGLVEDLGSSYSYDEENFDVSIDRTSPSWMEQVLQLYREKPLDQLQRSIKVSFVGEAGLDGGALSREFFFMLFNGLVSQPILSHGLFEGSRGHMLPAIDHVLTEARVYWFVGVLTAQAVNKGCKGFPGLCNAIRHFLFLGAKISNISRSLEKVTVEDIADIELRTVVEKVLQKKPLEEDEKAVFENWARDSNFSKVLGPATELEAVQRIFCHYVFNSRMTQIQAISEGINDIGIKNKQTLDVDQMFPVDEKLDFHDFMSGIHMEPSNWKQRQVRDFFQRFCQELHRGEVKGLTLEDLLQFFTGAPYFVSMIGAQVRFAESTEKSRLPVAHACASELILPTVHSKYSNFRNAMVKALEFSGTGFGIV